MGIRKTITTVTVLGLFAHAHAMDGVCITSFYPAPTYKWETTFGGLTKYEITADHVVKVDTLAGSGSASPRINMSGTYYAYLKNVNTTTRTLVIKPLYGNPQSAKEITLAATPVWIWWANDGSFFYTTPPGSQNKIRKVTLSRSTGQLVVIDRLWSNLPARIDGAFYDGIQGGFVGLSGDGHKLAYSDGQNARTALVSGDSTQVPTIVWINAIGCGYSISPSGDYFCQWPGGHNVWAWDSWEFKKVSGGLAFSTFVDSNWVVMGPNDPEAKLEVYYNGKWQRDPIGLMGADNNWSQNSENWFMSEVGAGILDGGDGSCFNATAVNWKDLKVINVSKIMPVDSVMSSRSAFRGVPFRGGIQWNADRPTLWCSSKTDVWDSLWHYVENRAADNQYWSDLLGLPLSQITTSSANTPKVKILPSKALSFRESLAGQNLTLPGAGRFTVAIVDVAGRQVCRLSGTGSSLALPRLGTGAYLVEVRQGGNGYSSRIVER